MNIRIILFIILGFFIFNSLSYSHAVRITAEWDEDEMPDTTRQSKADSIREAREHKADSLKQAREELTERIATARQHKADSIKTAKKHKDDSLAAIRKYKAGKHYKDSVSRARNPKSKSVKTPGSRTDSLKEARQQKADSLQEARKQRTDSAAAVRKYHDSKHYKDSVTRARAKKTNSLKAARQAHMDSLKELREHTTDSLATARKGKTDSIKSVQKKRTDSLAAKKKYRESKRYSDSVAVRKHEHADSIKNVQKATRDRMASVRKHSLDSSKTIRKKSMDSLKTVRTKHMDSLKTVRKAKTDSLTKVKTDKEKLAKAKEKKKAEAQKLKLELKIKQKHEAWSNKSMLKKNWGPVRRLTQNSFTHYNYYYNANRKMDEALLNMQRTRKENYDSLIGLYPFDPNRDSSLMLADMDSIIRKASIGLQIHDPRVKWSNDLYLLLGEAYYYKGNYEYASVAFRYIISSDEEAKKKKAGGGNSSFKSKDGPSILEDEKKSKLAFLKHKSVHNEAILWLARTYTEAHQPENAETVLSLLETDVKLPEDLEGRLAIEKAFAFLSENNLPGASKELAIAVEDENLPNWLRLRAAFLNGQILQNLGSYTEAANSFEQVIGYYPKIDMDFYSRKYIAFNRLMAGEDVDDAMKPLKNILHDAKYISYYDQVYYVLGQLATKAHEPDDAVTYYTNSTTTPKATRKQKALSFAALGDVYYSTSRYTNAKSAYDSAAKYSSAAAKDKTVIAAAQKGKGLEEISGPKKVIAEQDSLMALAAKSKKEQQAAVQRYLRYLHQKQEDSIKNAETASVATPLPTEPDGDKPSSDAANWYFGNATQMQQGSDDFKRKWGSRPLTDNWRRAASISAFSNNAGNGDEEAALVETPDNGLPTEASLLARIPNSQAQKDLSARLEQRAYMLLAKAYVKQLEDYNMAVLTMDTLDLRFPNHNQKEEELYLRYQIAIKQNKLDKAQQYAQELVAKFPSSQYADILRPKKSESRDDANTNKTVGAYFDETYNLLLQHQYTEALMRIDVGKKQYSGNALYMKRFEVAEAMGNAGMGDYDKADTIITHFLKTNTADTLTPWATTVKEYIKQVRNGGKPSWYYDTIPAPKNTGIAKRGNTGATPKAGPTPPPPPPPDIPSIYSYHADSEHYCIIVMPGVDSRTAGLKQGIKKFDAKSDSTANLSLLFDLYNVDLGVFVIKKFPNASQAKAYMTAVLSSAAVQDYKQGEVQAYIITAPNYRKMYAEKSVAPYVSFYNANYK